MKIDTNKNAVDNVLALINEANHVNWTSSMLTLGTPAPLTDGTHEGRNTQLPITAIPGQGLRGTNTVYYNRLGMLVNVANPQTEYTVNEETTESNLFATIVAALGLVATEVELVETLVPELPQITLQPKGISLLYNEDAVLTLNWEATTQTVDQLLPNGDLPGFVIPLIIVPTLLSVTDLPGFQKVTKAPIVWKYSIGPDRSSTEDVSFSFVNDTLWYCDSKKVYAFDPVDGTELYMLDLNARFAVGGNLGYAIRGVDGNGVLWVAEEGYYNVARPTIIRIDTTLMDVKDELLGGQPRVDGRSWTALTVNGATDFAWAYQAYSPSGGGTTYTLSRIDVTTGTYTDFGSIPIASGLTYDPASKILWLGYTQSGFMRKVDIYQLDGSNNPVLLNTIDLWDSTTGVMAWVGDTPNGREMIITDQDVDNDSKIYLRRYNATNGTWKVDIPISTPVGSSSIGPNGAVKYNPTTDEVYTTIFTATGAELWAFKRTDGTQSRMVAGMDGVNEVWDFALDTVGNRTFVFYDDDANVANYLVQMRQP